MVINDEMYNRNRVKLPKNNTSGILGVRFREDRNKWYSEIQCNKEKIDSKHQYFYLL